MNDPQRAPVPPVAPASKTVPFLWWCLLLLVVAAPVLLYAQVVRFDFVGLDDSLYVTENPYVRAGLVPRSIAWSFTTFDTANWIPLTWLSLMLDTTVFGVRPGGYHLTQLLLHAANTGLLFTVFARVTASPLRSAFVAALFALHPLHVESVAWISERKDVLSTLFGLLSLLGYGNFAMRGSLSSLAASLLCFVLSLLSKQTLVTLPFVFLLLDYWPLDRFERSTRGATGEGRAVGAAETVAAPRIARRRAHTRGLVIDKLPFFAASAVFSAVAVIAQAKGDAIRPFAVLPLETRCLNAVVAYAVYLWQTVWPLNLAVFYPYREGQLTLTSVPPAAALLLAISVAALAWVRRFPYLFVGWFWFLGTLVPMIGIVQIGLQQRADRYMYFPSIGLSLAVAWLVPELMPAGSLRKWVLPSTAVAALAFFAVTAYAQIGYWTDSVTLFNHALVSTDDNAFTRYMLGTARINRGEMQEGLADLESAVRLDPKDPQYHYNLANGLKRVGRIEEAVIHYRAALAVDDQSADAHNNLGLILLERRQYADARQHFSRALQIDENHLRACLNLAKLCLETGDYQKAIEYSRRALTLNRGLINAHLCIALSLRGQGRLDEAVAYLRHLATVAPEDEEVRRELGRTLAMKRAHP
jgi:tetratricopeptide (TPR) repeat protein